MHVIIGDQKVNLTQGQGGRLQATFTATEDTQSIRIPSDCFGNLKVSQLQVEKGDQATHFVEPQVYEAPLTGIFKDLREIKLEMTDETNSNLWSRIRANSAGMIREYHHDHISTEIAETAGQITQQIADTQRGLRSEITQTADGLERKITSDTQGKINRVIETVDGAKRDIRTTDGRVTTLGATVDGIASQVTDAEGDISTINQTVTGIRSQVQNNAGDISKLNQTASGLQAELKSADDRITSLTLTTSGLSSRITNNAGDISTIKQTVNAYERVIGRTEWQVRSNISSIVQNSGIIQSTVSSADLSTNKTISTIQTQLNNSWGVQIKSATEALTSINASVYGVRIKGSLIHLDGNTLINNGVIKNAHISSLSASKIDTGIFNAAQAKIINLDINTLTGNKTTFLQSIWQGMNSRSYIDGKRIRVSDNYGTFAELNNEPEFRTVHSNGTEAILGAGRVYFKDNLGAGKGILGVDLHGGTRDFGIWLPLGSDKFTIARDISNKPGRRWVPGKTYRAQAGDTYWKIADRHGLNVFQLAELNGHTTPPNHISIGQTIIVSQGYYEDTYSGKHYDELFTIGTSSDGSWRTYSHARLDFYDGFVVQDGVGWFKTQARFDNGATGLSDVRLKKNIEDTTVNASDEIKEFRFKSFNWKDTDKFQDIGLIAQDSNLLQVYDEEHDTYSIDLQRALFLSLKANQELVERVEKLECNQ